MSMGPAASKDTTTQQAAPTESRQSGTPLLDISLSPGVDKLTQEEKEVSITSNCVGTALFFYCPP